jgi:hypothetical protein
MLDITPYLTAAIMLLGIIIGTIINPRVQQRTAREYNRRDLIFQKKLKYFENIFETIEKNKKMYRNFIHKIENSKNPKIDKIIEELKKERKNFFIQASPLYLNSKIFSEKIIHFVNIEKNIFNRINQIKEVNKKEREEIIEQLKNDLKKLDQKTIEILCEMKKELAK